MIRVTSVRAKAPWLIPWPQRESQARVPPKQRDPAEQTAALKRSEAHYRRVRDVVGASFFMNGGHYL